MKYPWFTLIVAALLLAACGQAPELKTQQIQIQPVQFIGDNAAYDVVAHSAGAYTVGTEYYRGFLPSQVRSYNGYLRNYDKNGTLLWSKTVASEGGKSDSVSSVATDSMGNIYVAGWTEGKLAGATQYGGRDGFLRKYDPEGNVLWSQQLGTSMLDNIDKITLDNADNVYVAGRTYGTFPGNKRLPGDDKAHLFVGKFTSLGKRTWVIQDHDERYGSTFYHTQSVTGLAVTTRGYIVVVGQAYRQNVYDPQADGVRAYLSEIIVNGESAGFRGAGYDSSRRYYGLAAGSNNSLYIAGSCTFCFDDDSHNPSIPFVAKLDLDPSIDLYFWAWGYTSFTQIRGASRFTDVDFKNKTLFVSGYTYGTVNSAVQNKGSADAFNLRLWFDEKGTLLSYVGIQRGSSAFDVATAVSGLHLGESYMAGYTYGVLPGQTDRAGQDAFLWRGYQKGWGYADWLRQY